MAGSGFSLRQIGVKALMGEAGPFKAAHDVIVAYEKGDWGAFVTNAKCLGLDMQLMPVLFTDSLRWANHAFGLISAA